jgi:hypothetical protein
MSDVVKNVFLGFVAFCEALSVCFVRDYHARATIMMHLLSSATVCLPSLALFLACFWSAISLVMCVWLVHCFFLSKIVFWDLSTHLFLAVVSYMVFCQSPRVFVSLLHLPSYQFFSFFWSCGSCSTVPRCDSRWFQTSCLVPVAVSSIVCSRDAIACFRGWHKQTVPKASVRSSVCSVVSLGACLPPEEGVVVLVWVGSWFFSLAICHPFRLPWALAVIEYKGISDLSPVRGDSLLTFLAFVVDCFFGTIVLVGLPVVENDCLHWVLPCRCLLGLMLNIWTFTVFNPVLKAWGIGRAFRCMGSY